MSYNQPYFQMPPIPGYQNNNQQTQNSSQSHTQLNINDVMRQKEAMELEEDSKAFEMIKQMVSIFAGKDLIGQLDNIPDYLKDKIRWSKLLQDQQAKEHIGSIYKMYLNSQNSKGKSDV